MRLLALFLLAASAFAQAPANWLGAGASYNPYADPGGWIAYATLLSQKGPVYSFSEITITNATKGKFTPQTSVTTGFATTLRTFGPVSVMGLANVGVTTSSNATGSAYAGGGVVLWQIKPSLTLVVGAQMLRTSAQMQAVYSFGVGRSW